MSYVDGFVVPVPKANKDAYKAMAAKFAPLFKEFGAAQIVECWGDDIPQGKITDLWGAVKARPDENVVLAWIVWPSKSVRDVGMKRFAEDPRMKIDETAPFDATRMIFGGFEIILDVK